MVDNGHDFAVATLHKLTYCSLCHKFIWGLRKQACRCQYCRIEVHSKCAQNALYLPCPGRPRRTDARPRVDERRSVPVPAPPPPPLVPPPVAAARPRRPLLTASGWRQRSASFDDGLDAAAAAPAEPPGRPVPPPPAPPLPAPARRNRERRATTQVARGGEQQSLAWRPETRAVLQRMLEQRHGLVDRRRVTVGWEPQSEEEMRVLAGETVEVVDRNSAPLHYPSGGWSSEADVFSPITRGRSADRLPEVEAEPQTPSTPDVNAAAAAPPDTSNTCVVCLDNEADSVVLWCGHLCLCSACGKNLKSCPMCRQPIFKLQRVFRP
eukprot:m51a1_g11790 putative e3 ubiquitin-protein ligase neurl1b (323) ;mRNA; r:304586-305976